MGGGDLTERLRSQHPANNSSQHSYIVHINIRNCTMAINIDRIYMSLKRRKYKASPLASLAFEITEEIH